MGVVICPRCRVGQLAEGDRACPLCSYVVGAVRRDDEVPRELDQAVHEDLRREFEVQRFLGRGGMSVVYLARELELNRLVAVKILPLHLSMGADAVERFKREAKVAASLEHPHVVPVHRVGATPRLLWYSMKWVRGRSLQGVLHEQGTLGVADTLRIVESVAAALHYAHQRGIVHRDVKPANVLIDETGWVHVCDFGIAKAFGALPLTNTGAAVGTPGYMSPEQCYGRELDPRSDQYALAILAYECLTGALPFTGTSFGEIVRKHCMEPPPRITERRADVPAPMAGAIDQALRKEPESRFSDVFDFVEAMGGTRPARSSAILATGELSTLVSAPTARLERHRRPIGMAAAVIALLTVAGFFALRARQPAAVVPVPAPSATTATTPTDQPAILTANVDNGWANVVVDGRKMGATPQPRIELAPGPHTVQFEREGYETVTQTIEVSPGQTVPLLHIRLRKLGGS